LSGHKSNGAENYAKINELNVSLKVQSALMQSQKNEAVVKEQQLGTQIAALRNELNRAREEVGEMSESVRNAETKYNAMPSPAGL
jgi:chromosome segregation ATPase